MNPLRISPMAARNLIVPIIAILAMGCALLFVKFDRDSDMCKTHKEFFEASFTSALVIDKFVDKDHAVRKIKIKNKNIEYLVSLIPYENWSDFEEINVGDTTSKKANSFYFHTNKGKNFVLMYKCSYVKNN